MPEWKRASHLTQHPRINPQVGRYSYTSSVTLSQFCKYTLFREILQTCNYSKSFTYGSHKDGVRILVPAIHKSETPNFVETFNMLHCHEQGCVQKTHKNNSI